MNRSRRDFLQTSATALAAASIPMAPKTLAASEGTRQRVFQFTQIDVFTANKLEGNALAVFPDARGLTEKMMQDIARETNLQETTFVFPRNAATERDLGVKVRIFIPQQEIPFGGHPTLGTAMVLRNKRAAANKSVPPSEIALDLEVGRIPVTFSTDTAGFEFGEMRQIDPVFGKTHDREEIAAVIGVKPSDISDEWPVQTISTGLQFVVVPLKSLAVLQSLHPDQAKIEMYFKRDSALSEFYYVTRDTRDPKIGLRSRAIYAEGEDPATGSAAGCTAAWMVRYGVAQPGEQVRIAQGLEIKRPSHLYVRADKTDEKVTNVRVGGNAVEVMRGEYHL